MRTATLSLEHIKDMKERAEIWYVPPASFDSLVRGLRYLSDKVCKKIVVVYGLDTAPKLFETSRSRRGGGGALSVHVDYGESKERSVIAPKTYFIASKVEETLKEKVPKNGKVIVFIVSGTGFGKDEREYCMGIIEGAWQYAEKNRKPVIILVNRYDAIPDTKKASAQYLVSVDVPLRDAIIRSNLSEVADEVALAILPTHIAFLQTSLLTLVDEKVEYGIKEGHVGWISEKGLVFKSEFLVELIQDVVERAAPMIERCLRMNVEEDYYRELAILGNYLDTYYSSKLESLLSLGGARISDIVSEIKIPIPSDSALHFCEFKRQLKKAIPQIREEKSNNKKFLSIENLLLVGATAKAIKRLIRDRCPYLLKEVEGEEVEVRDVRLHEVVV